LTLPFFIFSDNDYQLKSCIDWQKQKTTLHEAISKNSYYPAAINYLYRKISEHFRADR